MKKTQHRQVKMIRYNRKSPLSKQQKGGVECLCLRFLTGQTGQSKVRMYPRTVLTGQSINPTQTGENDKVQQKITSFQTAKGGSRVDNQDPILKELTTYSTAL
jgi:hypothetical protein